MKNGGLSVRGRIRMSCTRWAFVLAAVGFAALLPGAAAVANTTFDTQCPSGQTCPETESSYVFTSGGFSTTGEAFQVNTGTIGSISTTTDLTSVSLGLLSSGLGVGSSPVNNAPANGKAQDGFIVFQLPANSTVVSISLYSSNTSPDAATIFVGGGSGTAFTSLASFSNATIATLDGTGFTTLNFANQNPSTGSGGTFTDTLTTPAPGAFLVIAGALGSNAPTTNCNATKTTGCDSFEVASIVLDPPRVPEPSSLALLVAGVGLYVVKRRRRTVSEGL
jgi:hypothetical protein